MKISKQKKIADQKDKLRRHAQKLRDSIAPQIREHKSKKIAKKLFKTKYYINSKNILIFYPFRSEIDTTLIIRDAIKEGKNIILPRVVEKSLELYFVDNPDTQLKKGSFSISEPAPSLCRKATLQDIDLAIIPGLAFDKNLNRLGYGGGFYDRLLSNLPVNVKRIAIAFDIQIMPYIPTSEYDEKIDLVITESKTYSKK